MCDGLEWCRTYSAQNFHLHHFQHKDLFVDAASFYGNPAVDVILTDSLPYPTVAASRNLLSFQTFTKQVQDQMALGTADQFIAQHFGEIAGSAIWELQS